MPNEKLAGSLKDSPADYLRIAKPLANARRLALQHARAKVSHTGDKITPPFLSAMIVIDRHEQGHLLRPGQSVEIEMVVDEIERFRELRRPGRMISKMVQLGELYVQRMVEAPPHALL